MRVTSLASSLFLVASCSTMAAPDDCDDASEVQLQILGSGGPIADDARASSSYLIWVDGEARVLIDAGSGSSLRFGEAGAEFAALDFVGLSHFHTDHAGDFAALLKTGNFSGRSRPLAVAGPSGTRRFPGIREFLRRLLDSGEGTFAYLSGYLDGSDGLVKLEVAEVDIGEVAPRRVFEGRDGSIVVDALPVPHGIVPAVGFRVRANGRTLVFASDQNGSSEALAEFARDADVLVAHLAIPENAGRAARQLHAPPSAIAELANAAAPDVLVLSHFMQRSLRDASQAAEIVSERFAGTVLAEDLMCISVR